MLVKGSLPCGGGRGCVLEREGLRRGRRKNAELSFALELFSIPRCFLFRAIPSICATFVPYRFERAMDPVEETPPTWSVGGCMALSKGKKAVAKKAVQMRRRRRLRRRCASQKKKRDNTLLFVL